MNRLLLLLACVLLLVAGPSVHAQPAASPPVLTAEQARQALDVLNDPRKRAEMAATLQAIAAPRPAAADPAAPAAPPAPAPTPTAPAAPPPAPATPAAAPAKPVAPPSAEALVLPLAPDSLGAQVLVSVEGFLDRMSDQTMNALRAVRSVPLLWGWAVVMTTDPWARGVLLDVSWRVLVAVACGLAVEWGLRFAVRRPVSALEANAPGAVPMPAGAPAAGTPRGAAQGASQESGRDAGEGTPEGGTPQGVSQGTSQPKASEVEDPEEEDSQESDAERGAELGDFEPLPPRLRRRPSAWTLIRRIPLVMARLALELVPVIGFAVAGHLVAGTSVAGESLSRLVMLAVVDAYAACLAVLCLVRMVLSPRRPRLRLVHLPDAAARATMRWIRRLVVIGVFGYAGGEIGLLLGMSVAAHQALLKSVGLVLHLCLAWLVLRNRREVRAMIRAPAGATGITARLRNLLGSVWHWIALFFLVAGWLVWAVEVPHGYAWMLRFFFVTAAVLLGARIVLVLVLGSLDRAVHARKPGDDRQSSVGSRLLAYHPVLVSLTRFTVAGLSLLLLCQLWGLGVFEWFAGTDLGRRLISAFGELAVTFLVSLLVWEAVNAAMQRQLAKMQRDAQSARSARLRTLQPLLRTCLLVTILVVAGLMVLSEIGVNIAPLLAGAGIVGVAIGFGSQKLVQDLITGIFLLLENAMQVGDWVTVSGLSGTVEALSVRTIRLRAGDGSVHIIPFSAVTSVTNVNRGLGNAEVNVTVAFHEDIDRVSVVLKDIVSGLRKEPEFSGKMLSDLQLWGVDHVNGAAVTITGQIVCTDSGRWPVQREFNRRLKRRFEALGIEIFNPMQSIAWSPPVPDQPASPSAHITVAGE